MTVELLKTLIIAATLVGGFFNVFAYIFMTEKKRLHSKEIAMPDLEIKKLPAPKVADNFRSIEKVGIVAYLNGE